MTINGKLWMRFILGLVAGLVIAGLVPLAVIALGWVNWGASHAPGRLEETLAGWALERSVEHRAPRTPNPLANDIAAREAGLVHYRELCLDCHGAPNVRGESWADGLNPPVPKLHAGEFQEETSDGEIFWIVQNGIRLTGMPAFGETLDKTAVWQVVAFVRHLPQITDAERERLRPQVQDRDTTATGPSAE